MYGQALILLNVIWFKIFAAKVNRQIGFLNYVIDPLISYYLPLYKVFEIYKWYILFMIVPLTFHNLS